MEKRVGLWIDRNKAVIVSIDNNVEHRRTITSDMEHYVQYSTIALGNGSSAYIRDSRFWSHLDAYYNDIIEHIHEAAEIQIFGPDGAKYELQKRLESKGLAGHIVSVEDTHKLTDHQIATRVLQRFHSAPGSISPDRKSPLLPQVAETNTLQPMDAAGECLLYDEYRSDVHPLDHKTE